MITELRKWLILALVGLALILATLGVSRCSKTFQQPTIGPRIDSIIVVRHDTLVKLDTIRKTRIKYIDTSRIDTVHDMLDRIIPIDTADNDGNQVIASNQLREALKWKDSLNTCIEFRKVDSSTIDTLSKLAKTFPDTIKITPSILDRVKDIGIGFLLGAGVRSFF